MDLSILKQLQLQKLEITDVKLDENLSFEFKDSNFLLRPLKQSDFHEGDCIHRLFIYHLSLSYYRYTDLPQFQLGRLVLSTASKLRRYAGM